MVGKHFGEGLNVTVRWNWNVMDGLIPKFLKAPKDFIQPPIIVEDETTS